MVDSDHVIPRDSDSPTDRVSSPSGSRARLQHPPRVHVCLHVVTLIYIILSVNDAPYIVVFHAQCVPVCIHVIYRIIIRKMHAIVLYFKVGWFAVHGGFIAGLCGCSYWMRTIKLSQVCL